MSKYSCLIVFSSKDHIEIMENHFQPNTTNHVTISDIDLVLYKTNIETNKQTKTPPLPL